MKFMKSMGKSTGNLRELDKKRRKVKDLNLLEIKAVNKGRKLMP